MNLYIFDCEVFAYDWLFVFKEYSTGQYTVIHNDNDSVKAFMESEPLLCGFNNKHYDQFILKAVLSDATPEQVKAVNDFIIVDGNNGWENGFLQQYRCFFNQFDLFDDCQDGVSLKSIEAHLGMNIQETEVDFNLDRPLTEEELQQTVFYCKHDVDATEILYKIRSTYLSNKAQIGREVDLMESRALYMTNAKLTAAYLKAEPHEYTDEREYQYPKVLKREYIPQEVFDFFDRLYDPSIPSSVIFKEKLKIMVGDCPVTIAYGGIHGAIPNYRETATDTRRPRNKDVASYYPHQMTLNGYCSRNIPNPQIYADTIEKRVTAKKTGDKATANALKLVLNTTYGAMLNQYNDLYDPLMGRSVCISGQLQLLELAEHLLADVPSLRVIQLNTDGIMVSLDDVDEPLWQEITQEWQDRTGFELEEDIIQSIVQKDVNNYIEVAENGEVKLKGGEVVRGVLTNGKIDFTTMGFPAWNNLTGGAFNINNSANIVAKAITEYFLKDIPPRQTVYDCTEKFDFQIIAKAGGSYDGVFQTVKGKRVEVQRCNRVYATDDWTMGTLEAMSYSTDPDTGEVKENYRKIGKVPAFCLVDNDNHLTIDDIDREWYVRQAESKIKDFIGTPDLDATAKKSRSSKKAARTRKLNKLKSSCFSLLGGLTNE